MRKTENKPIPLAGTSLGKGRNRAFTLVELIIVITILAILATIGFMSYQSYTTDSRDGKRKRDLGEIRTGLELYQAKNTTLPTPDEKLVRVYTGTTDSTIALQGYMGATAQKAIRISEVKDDETENIYYTYSTNASKTKYSLLAMLESQENLAMKNNLVNQTYASLNYYSRHPYTIGNYAVFFSGTTNTPLQNITGTGLDLSLNTTQQIKAIISGTGANLFTGSELPGVIEKLTNSTATTSSTASTLGTPVIPQWKDKDSNCTNNDITIGTQTWAGCNSTLGTGIEYNAGNNCRDYNSHNIGGTTCYGYLNKENRYNSTYGLDNIWGKLYTWANAPSACSTGRHLPSDQEWNTLENTLNGSVCRDITQVGAADNDGKGDGWECDGLGWSGSSLKNDTNNIIKALKLPMSGARYASKLDGRGGNAYLWSSTTSTSDSNYAIGRALGTKQSTVLRYYRAKGATDFSVRCIKD